MQFPYSWLKTQSDPALSPDQLAHLLTMAGLEVEETLPAAPAFSGVVVAEVKSVEKHPDADRLNITQVDAGTGSLLQIVCGAPNVAAGIKVPCALAGAVLPGNFKIKPTKMRGAESNGMLCSAKELGLPENGIDGLLVLPQDAPVGTNIREYLDLDDTLFTLKITPNRADCLSIKGIAREIAALTGCTFRQPEIRPVPPASSKTQPVRIDAPADCGRFLSRVVENVDARAATPDWMRQRLERCGIRSVSALVDIGNYVMLELGQPMHVYDAARLSGSLTVRRAKEGETLVCLNEKTVTLSADTLVVADEKGVLGIAGLMGGAASAVSAETRSIVLEAAWFAPETIAGKSRRYGFGSDSSFRFERGVDYALQHDAMERATELVLQICGGTAGAVTEALGELPAPKRVSVRSARMAKVLGADIATERIGEILQRLGLQPENTAEGFAVTAPTFRYDIEIEADLIEEIARVHGYENIPAEHTHGRLAMLGQPENTGASRRAVTRAVSTHRFKIGLQIRAAARFQQRKQIRQGGNCDNGYSVLFAHFLHGGQSARAFLHAVQRNGYACGLRACRLNQPHAFPHGSSRRNHVVNNQHAPLQRRAHQHTAFAVVFRFFAVIRNRHVDAAFRQHHGRCCRQNNALIGRPEQHIKRHTAFGDCLRIKARQPQHGCAVVKQPRIEKIRRLPPRFGGEFTKFQYIVL